MAVTVQCAVFVLFTPPDAVQLAVYATALRPFICQSVGHTCALIQNGRTSYTPSALSIMLVNSR